MRPLGHGTARGGLGVFHQPLQEKNYVHGTAKYHIDGQRGDCIDGLVHATTIWGLEVL